MSKSNTISKYNDQFKAKNINSFNNKNEIAVPAEFKYICAYGDCLKEGEYCFKGMGNKLYCEEHRSITGDTFPAKGKCIKCDNYPLYRNNDFTKLYCVNHYKPLTRLTKMSVKMCHKPDCSNVVYHKSSKFCKLHFNNSFFLTNEFPKRDMLMSTYCPTDNSYRMNAPSISNTSNNNSSNNNNSNNNTKAGKQSYCANLYCYLKPTHNYPTFEKGKYCAKHCLSHMVPVLNTSSIPILPPISRLSPNPILPSFPRLLPIPRLLPSYDELVSQAKLDII